MGNAMIELSEIVEHYTWAFQKVDAQRPVYANYQPGLGPFGEPHALKRALRHLQAVYPHIYSEAGPRAYPGASTQCDLVLPGAWAIEWKLIRPFGDNGRPAEHWSENVLHPYTGNTSSIGDCLKLLRSHFTERKAVLVYGFEHTPPIISLDPAIRAFEVVATQVVGVRLGPRHTAKLAGLVHPIHQQVTVFGWEVLKPSGM